MRRPKLFGDPRQRVEAIGWDERLLVPALGPCWETRAPRTKRGYGQVQIARKTYLAHRVMFGAYVRAIQPGELIRHRCDNPPCVNPEHLLAGTSLDNEQDKISRGRRPFGEDLPCSKGSAAQVAEIRQRVAGGETQRSVAARYGISQPNVSLIVRGLIWKSSRQVREGEA